MALEELFEVSSHKAQGGQVITSAELLAKLGANGLHFVGNPEQEGSLFFGKDCLAYGWLKPVMFRSGEGIHTSDILPLFNTPRPDAETVSVYDLMTGTEIEMNVFNPKSQDIEPIMEPGHPVRADLEAYNQQAESTGGEKLNYSEEVGKHQLELNLAASSNRISVTNDIFRSLKVVRYILQKHSLFILPTATLPHRSFERTDINESPYLQLMAHDVLGWEHAKYFTCTSVQGHTELLTPEAGLFAINQLQHISPLLYAMTLAAPFTHGEPSGLSGRYAMRREHSPSGGIFVDPLPEDLVRYYPIPQRQLKEGLTPSGARGGGQHCDRLRNDIPPHGTIENCEADTAGDAPFRIASYQYLKDVILWKLQQYRVHGREGELYEKMPDFFTPPTKETMERAHINSLAVGQDGMDATFLGNDGREYTVREQFIRLLEFANRPLTAPDGQLLYKGLPPAIVIDLRKSSMKPDKRLLRNYRRNGAVGTEGYYQTGIGTLAHWMRERYYDLTENGGMTSKEAIMDCSIDAAQSLARHLRVYNPAVIEQYFSSAT